MKSQVLHAVWWNISGEAAGAIWLLKLKLYIGQKCWDTLVIDEQKENQFNNGFGKKTRSAGCLSGNLKSESPIFLSDLDVTAFLNAPASEKPGAASEVFNSDASEPWKRTLSLSRMHAEIGCTYIAFERRSVKILTRKCPATFGS